MKLTKKILTIATVTTIAVVGSIYSISATTSDIGTSSDPLVTKSYVDEAVGNLLTIFGDSSSSSASLGTTEDTTSTTSAQAFEPVQVMSGQTLLGEDGTEIILRSGTAVSFCMGENGIINVTTGSEYYNGSSISANNLLIVPRGDGRGVAVTSEEAWFIIKGGYSIN